MVLTLAPLPAAALPLAYTLEKAGYPADEAAAEKTLIYRQEVAGSFFYGLFGDVADGDNDVVTKNPDACLPVDSLVGFVCSTLAQGELTEETMTKHDANGATLCIHSVVVAEKHRRRKLATKMLAAYLDAVAREKTVRLLCHDALIPLYKGVGFELLGKSKVVHGAALWYDMEWKK
eukprot:GEMP01076901.1.p1 GENE.GEMP01076901.1~~GEMP01076901.1.p1  ORF type:complete len:176 (+),score=45.16 GEMP01076901.1:38-565(+)